MSAGMELILLAEIDRRFQNSLTKNHIMVLTGPGALPNSGQRSNLNEYYRGTFETALIWLDALTSEPELAPLTPARGFFCA